MFIFIFYHRIFIFLVHCLAYDLIFRIITRHICVVMARGDGLEEKDVKYVSDILGAVGKIWEIEEKYFDAVTGLR